MFFSFFFLFFFISFFNNFSKPTFSASSVSIGKKFYLNGKKVNIYSKNLDTEVFDEDLENSFFLSSNPQIFDLSKYQKIDSYEFKDVLDEVKSLKINAYYDSENDNKRFLIDLNSINDENFPNLSSCLIKDSKGKSIAFESLFLIPVIVEALKNVSSDSIDGIVVDGNKTTITNTNLGLYGLVRINNNDFSKTGIGVDIRAANKKIMIGNSDPGDPVVETCNLTIGNTTGFTHLYGGVDFSIRTANSGTLTLGDSNDNSKINMQSGTNQISIGSNSTGNINIGNGVGDVNLNTKNLNLSNCIGSNCSQFQINIGSTSLRIASNKGDTGSITLGNNFGNTHFYGKEIWLIGKNSGNILIGTESDNSKIDIESGDSEINIGSNSRGNLNIGNYNNITKIDGQSILIGHNEDLVPKGTIIIGDLGEGSRIIFRINSDYVKDATEGHAADDNIGLGYYSLMVSESGNLYRTASTIIDEGSSSKKYKENIKKAEIDSEKFKKLLPVVFDYKKEINSGKKNQWGLIAEDVSDLGFIDAIEFDKDGEIYGLNYRTIFMMLLRSYLDSLKKLENFEDRINALEEENLSLKNKNLIFP